MIDFHGMWTLQGELFLLMALGFLFRRRNLAGEAFQKGLAEVVIDLVLPCNIICSFQTPVNGQTLRQTGSILLASLAIQLGCWLLAKVAFRRCEAAKRPSLQYGTICSNAGFLGTPLAEGLFGAQGALLAAIYLIPQRIAMWSLGISFFTQVEGRAFWKKTATHPCLIAAGAGVIIMAAQIRLPSILDQTIHALGSCNTALSMFLIGMIMSKLRWRDFLDRDTLCFTAVRLAVIPALVLLGCRLAGMGGLSEAVAVLLAAMPAGGTTAIVAAKYGGDAEFAAGCVTVSTVLSLIAIPLWCLAF